MRRIPRVAGAALLVCAAVAVTAPPASASFEINITPGTEGRVVMVGGEPGDPGRTVGYWGKFTGPRSGSYRATCVWLADTAPDGDKSRRDPRLMCTIVLSFRAGPEPTGDPNGGTVVAQGLVRRPLNREFLFSRESRKPGADPANPPPSRTLPITGTSGYFKPYRGVLWVSGIRTLWLALDVA